MTGRSAKSVDRLPRPSGGSRGTVGVLLMRSYILANNTAHYDAVIAALEARGLANDPGFRERPRRSAGRSKPTSMLAAARRSTRFCR